MSELVGIDPIGERWRKVCAAAGMVCFAATTEYGVLRGRGFTASVAIPFESTRYKWLVRWAKRRGGRTSAGCSAG